MIIAEIYFCGTCVKRSPIDQPRPPMTIRECAHRPLQALDMQPMMPDDIFQQQIDVNIWLFSLQEQVGHNVFRYEFDGKERCPTYAKPMGQTWDVGFSEPTEKVNLNLLAAKCVKRKRVRDLLVKYYRV